MVRTASIIGLLAIALLASAATASAEDDFSRSGCYVGMSTSLAFMTEVEDDLEDDFIEGFDSDESWGFSQRAGCRGRWLGGELHYEWIDGFDVSSDTRSKTLDAWALTADFKFWMAPGRFQPFLTTGFGYLEIDNEWDFAARLGGGLDIYITRNVVLNLDTTYVIPTSDEELNGADFVSVGVGIIYRF
jgi:opacity protein-like surface antigen